MRLSFINVIPKRYIIAIMILFTTANLFFLHTNLAMALVELTTLKNITHLNGSTELNAEMNWNSKEKGIILSTCSYGRLLCPVVSFLAARIGGATTCSIGNLMMSLFTLSAPVLYANANFIVIIIFYAMLGIFEGFLHAGLPQLLSRWALPNERSRFTSLSLIGVYCGAITSSVTSGWILQTYGSDVLFYGGGCISFVWFCMWSLVVRNDPSEDNLISDAERRYILEVNSAKIADKLVYPWKSMLTYLPFWCACLSFFTVVCGNTFISLYLPQFIKDMYNTDIKRIGYVSSIPKLSALTATLICGFLCDYIRSRKILSITNTHKLFTSIGLFAGSVAFLAVILKPGFVNCVVTLTIFEVFATFALIDVLVLLLDFAPRYAAFLESTAHMASNFGASVVPIIVGFVVTSHSSSQWNTMFGALSLLNFVSLLVYLKFVTAEECPWANYSTDQIKKQSDGGENS